MGFKLPTILGYVKIFLQGILKKFLIYDSVLILLLHLKFHCFFLTVHGYKIASSIRKHASIKTNQLLAGNARTVVFRQACEVSRERICLALGFCTYT